MALFLLPGWLAITSFRGVYLLAGAPD